jgi:AI-2 transport system ATP-binding protein
LSTKPKLVILDEPTRGIDAGARSDVYSIILGLKKTGVAILLISSDMEEIVQLSDRVVTMYRGRINQEFKKEEINQDSIMSASFGITKKENK